MAIIQSVVPAASLPDRQTETGIARESRPTGSFQGERVHYVSISQSMADAAEELTFALSERVEKSLAKRSVSDGHARLSEILEMLEEHLRKVPDLESQQKLDALVAHLGSGQLNNLAQLKAYLKGFSREISHQFVALTFARKELADKTDAWAIVELIDQTLLEMAQERGRAIELGLKIGPLAKEAAEQGIGDIQSLRDTYRDAVMDYRGLSAAWDDIHARFSNSALEGVTGFLMKALSADLDSQQAWIDPIKLERVMSDMHKLRVLKGLSDQVNALWQALVTGERVHGIRAF
ncbi:type III secretion system gatekeeper subunit SctW [Pseudomonas sp. Irchel 3E19]|uniref:type III secretion system gatekeeper subunit SctW n=1 Tax=Pseudomonas sp. Irchel 3E19 TaxID=2008981 RepID=UPI000BA484D4|nr:type III secretion system gatekeeper subunit SctW [Pseudomonas sp. Irchel 3E19]